MAPVVWYLVLNKDGRVSTEYRVWTGYTRKRTMELLAVFTPPGITFGAGAEWMSAAVLKVDEDESDIIPF